ncbi:MAG TPA: BTAD domain-containing putative transcriptional regulator [Chloroflexota bacterium]|jgi:DNA-binding SARP family transcriptional activator
MVTDCRDPATAELYGTLFGTFGVYRAGRQLPIAPRGAVAELSRYLVAHAGRGVPRDELVELVWPEVNHELAVHRLHVAVSTLRRELNGTARRNRREKSPLRLEDDKYCVAADAIVTDCDLFEAHYRHGKAERDRAEYASAARCFREAVAVYAGEFVADRPYAEWAERRRTHFAERRLDVLDWLCEHALRESDMMSLLEYGREILEFDNLRERTHRHLMRAHYYLGDRGLAIRQYQQCAHLLESELGVLPSQQTQQLHHAIRDDSPLPSERLMLD